MRHSIQRYSLACYSAALVLAALPTGVALAEPSAMVPEVQMKAARSVRGAAYELLKKHVEQYDRFAFMDKSSIGGIKSYRNALLSVDIKIDPKLNAMALYDPKTKTIILSKDPRRIKPSEAASLGDTIWHELTHRIEDIHGDFGVFDSRNYAERNVEYMEHVIGYALPVLKQLEQKAAAGVPKATLQRLWKIFARRMNEALRLDSTKAYPPDLVELRNWTGFDVSLTAIKMHYASGAAGEALKDLFAPPPPPPPVMDLSGEWSTDWGDMTLTQSGNTVTGTYTHDSGRITGTLSGNTVTGTWAEAPSYTGDSDSGQFVWTLSADFRSFSGTWGYGSATGSGSWAGTKK